MCVIICLIVQMKVCGTERLINFPRVTQLRACALSISKLCYHADQKRDDSWVMGLYAMYQFLTFHFIYGLLNSV